MRPVVPAGTSSFRSRRLIVRCGGGDWSSAEMAECERGRDGKAGLGSSSDSSERYFCRGGGTEMGGGVGARFELLPCITPASAAAGRPAPRLVSEGAEGCRVESGGLRGSSGSAGAAERVGSAGGGTDMGTGTGTGTGIRAAGGAGSASGSGPAAAVVSASTASPISI